jgi:hypothetical protein
MTNTIEGKGVDVVVAWYCERDGMIQLATGFVASNRAYVEQHKDCDWRPLLHPDVVAELIEAAQEHEWVPCRQSRERLVAALARATGATA